MRRSTFAISFMQPAMLLCTLPWTSDRVWSASSKICRASPTFPAWRNCWAADMCVAATNDSSLPPFTMGVKATTSSAVIFHSLLLVSGECSKSIPAFSWPFATTAESKLSTSTLIQLTSSCTPTARQSERTIATGSTQARSSLLSSIPNFFVTAAATTAQSALASPPFAAFAPTLAMILLRIRAKMEACSITASPCSRQHLLM
mmetsp:Transcript_5235/g.11642  ORF Transcript_5235/g.11642 Transcript_5235/m.11642 type:complete len:203 (+) Transcript_5235:694-1302(+)